jgi:ribosome maturation factor RimP
MSRTPQIQKLISIVEPVLLAAGYELVDLRFLLDQGGWVLRVCIDLPLGEKQHDISEVPEDRVDLTDCAEMSRELSAVLDVEDPIPQAYTLEVGSPGIDRPLRTAAHFAHFAGSDAKVQLAMGLPMPNGPERKNFRGVLRGVVAASGGNGDRLKIEVDGQLFELPIADVEQAKLVPDWDAVMRGKSGVGAKEPAPIKPGHRPSKKKTPSNGGSDVHND